MAQNDFVSVTIVTYNSGRFIKRCLESVLSQRYPLKEVIVVDNASTDGTIDILEQFEDRCQVYYNEENMGFAAAQNQAIKLSNGDWVLTLNPDVLLLPNFIQALVDAGQFDSRIGSVCGKLLTMTAHFEIPEQPVVDSTGIYFNPMLRHLDRGSQEVDNGHYLQYEYVFGATAAAALYRRAMIDEISLDGEFFDSDFFVYREDADVAWRAQLMGWKCLYAPHARGYHVRKVLPGQPARTAARDQHALGEEPLPDAHQEHLGNLYWRNWFSITGARPDGGHVLPACGNTLRSRPSGILLRNLKRVLAKRRQIQVRRRVDDEYMASWFQYAPVSKRRPRKWFACCRAPPPRRRRGRACPARFITGPMRIALLGTRGIPANYGGFETFAEELSARLAARGHEVTVYSRSPTPNRVIAACGFSISPPFAISTSTLFAMPCFRRSTCWGIASDVALYCNGANAIFTALPRMFGMPVALNVDGIERQRKKWNRLAKAWYLVSERLSTFCPTVVVTDALAIQDYYRRRYGKGPSSFPTARRWAKWKVARRSRNWDSSPAGISST
jgi:GT2 family glycosyltransferase